MKKLYLEKIIELEKILKIEFKNKDLLLQSEEVRRVRFYPLDLLKKDLLDPIKSKEYLNHPQSYYLETIERIRALEK